jgi:hypothetical protein
MGPILIFDKSTLESLSVDEAVWLDTHYSANITPLFFVETLADLEKEVGKGRTPEQVVGDLAGKTPTGGGRPNVYHTSLCVAELSGNPVEMRGVPVIGGGKPVVVGGRRGVVFRQQPEIDALQRWEKGKFLEVEHEFARAWRQLLSGLDLDLFYREGKATIERHGRPRDLPEAKTMAVALLEKPGSRYTRETLEALLPDDVRRVIVNKWRAEGAPPIRRVAPYTAHVLTVDLFFCIALGADLISRERPSNKIDVAYLYYLPFCMVFTSGDKLHARTAPLFLTENQIFIWGQELKADLAKLDAYYSGFPEEIKRRGVMSFAHFPPTDGNFLVARLWDKLMSARWREGAAGKRGPTLDDGKKKKIIEELTQMMDAPGMTRGGGDDFSTEDADAVVLEHRIPVFKGKWRLLPPEVEKKASL